MIAKHDRFVQNLCREGKIACPAVISIQESPHVGERHHERHRFSRRRIEAKRLIERLGLIRNSLNDDPPDADRVGRLLNPQGAVAKKRSAEAPALLRAVDGQPAEHDNRDRLRHVAPKAANAACLSDRAGGHHKWGIRR